MIKQGVRQGAAIGYAMVDLPDSLALCIYSMSRTPCANKLEEILTKKDWKMSEYQEAKVVIVSILELSKDSIHMHVGLIVFFLAVVLWKKGSIEARCLIPVAIVASLMEILDLRYDYVSLGYFRLKAITASIHDLINTTFWPVVIVVLAWMGKLNNARDV